MDEAVICPNCGCATGKGMMQNNMPQNNEEFRVLSSINSLKLPALLCAFLVPLVGLILSIVGFSKISSAKMLPLSADGSNQLAIYKKSFTTSLILSIVMPIAYIILYMIMLEAFF